MRKTLTKLSLVSLLAASFSVVAPNLVSAQDSETIATVGEVAITKDEFYEALKEIAGPITLRTLILETVLEQNVADAEALKTAAADEVDQQVEEAGGEEIFQQLIQSQQLGTLEEYEYQIYIRNLFQEVVETNIDMSDEAIMDYYENQYEPIMEAQHILVETEDEATAAIERYNNGEEFDALAMELSLDGTAQNGGLLQPFTTGTMVPEFEEAVRALENGEITQEPVESQFGFHVIKTINNGEKLPFEEVSETVTEQYKNSKFADTSFAYGVIGQTLIDSGYEINDEDLQDAVQDLVDLANAQSAEANAEETEGSDTSEGEETVEETEASEEVEETEATEETEE